MTRRVRVIVSVLLMLTMVFSMNVASAFADVEGGAAPQYSMSKVAGELDENSMSDVTLSVGGVQEPEAIDIVFIMGGRVAENDALCNSIIEAVRPILEAGGTVKIGIVVFADKPDNIAVDLNSEEAVLTAENVDEKIPEFLERAQKQEGATNMEGALIGARNMLDADTSVKPENKHMFLISTGLTHFFSDENGSDATIAVKDAQGNYIFGNRVWQKYRVNWTHNATTQYSSYPVHPAYNDDFGAYWDDIEEWVEKDIDNGDKYVYSLNGEPYGEWYPKNSTSNSARTGTMIKTPAATDGIPHFDLGADPTTTPAAQHALNYERSMYEAWTVYNEMETPVGESFTTVLEDRPVIKGKGYNCYAIGSMPEYWKNNSSNLVDAPNWSHNTGLQIGHSFMNFLNGSDVAMYDSALGEDSFNEVVQEFTYTIAGGTKVEDSMGYGEGYNFDFVDDADALKLTVGNKEYTTTKVETAEGATSSYEFTAPGAEEATFRLDYTYGDGLEGEHFVWNFNQKVYVDFEGVSLSYKVKLVEKAEGIEVQYGETNRVAILYPVNINREEEPPLYFDKPTIDLNGGTPEQEGETAPPPTIDEEGEQEMPTITDEDAAAPETPAEDSVQTGDNFAMGGMILLAAAAVAVMVAALRRKVTE